MEEGVKEEAKGFVGLFGNRRALVLMGAPAIVYLQKGGRRGRVRGKCRRAKSRDGKRCGNDDNLCIGDGLKLSSQVRNRRFGQMGYRERNLAGNVPSHVERFEPRARYGLGTVDPLTKL
ncbi:hypothetical protein Nepgr_014850 [Nepenthes gracilis]|uniref:Uncharacterized protein n=1 Tax=Nepenthes gracilis TaxID=150966 RepID=A0AAD3SLV3_NEPGR|nr:hypothetical protein Nepgr_014850 [Nepenthes gracilis]